MTGLQNIKTFIDAYRRLGVCLILSFILLSESAIGGPYAPAVGKNGSTAVSKDSSEFGAWATGYMNLVYGNSVTDTWKTPAKALGAATGQSTDIVSLGMGGTITLTFDQPIQNGPGWDFAVFENSFSDTFLELAYVEVSSNGIDFVRFENHSLTPSPVGGFGVVNTTDIDGLAGKYRVGYGTPFDLVDLVFMEAVTNGTVDLTSITHIKIIDVIGDGSCLDSGGNPIYDPFPTYNSTGFDLEAVGIRQSANNNPPYQPVLLSPTDTSTDVSLTTVLTIDEFSDPDVDDGHQFTYWQLATSSSFDSNALILDVVSGTQLTSLTIPHLFLTGNTTYYWKTRVYDTAGSASDWSDHFEFTTADVSLDTNVFTLDWDNDGSTDADIPTITVFNSAGETINIGVQADSNIDTIETIINYDSDEFDLSDDISHPKSLPLGVIGLKIQVEDPDQPVVYLTVYLSKEASANTNWYNYDQIGGWSENNDAFMNDKRNRITLKLKNGSIKDGDNDGAKNGIIIHVGGIGVTKKESPTKSDEAGIGENGGCFVSTTKSKFSFNHLLLITLILSTLIVTAVMNTVKHQVQSNKKDKK